MSVLAGLSPSGTLIVRAGEPKVLNVALAQADGTTPQNLQGRTFALVIRRTDRLQPLITFPAELSADGLYVSIMMTAEQASAIHEAGRELALSYEFVELSGGASVMRFSQRVKTLIGPELPSDIVPVWTLLPYTRAMIRPDALVISERGAAGDNTLAVEAAALASTAASDAEIATQAAREVVETLDAGLEAVALAVQATSADRLATEAASGQAGAAAEIAVATTRATKPLVYKGATYASPLIDRDGRLLSATLVDSGRQAGSAPALRQLTYKGTGPYSRIIIDRDGRVLAGINGATGATIDGVAAATSAMDARFARNQLLYLGSTYSSGLRIDRDGRIVAGAHQASGFSIDGRAAAIAAISDRLGSRQLRYLGSAYAEGLAIDRDGRLIAGFNVLLGAAGAGGAAYAYQPRPALPQSGMLDYTAYKVIIYIVYGQSLGAGQFGLPPYSVAQPYQNLTFGSGPRSGKPGNTRGSNNNPGTSTMIALIENAANNDAGDSMNGESVTSGVNFATELAALENAISPADLRFFACNAARGAYSQAVLNTGTEWCVQVFDAQIAEAYQRCADAGLTAAFGGIILLQGEADRSTSIVGDTWMQGWLNFRANKSAAMKAISGQQAEVPLFIYQTASGSVGANGQDGKIQKAILKALKAKTPHLYFGGPVWQMTRPDGNQHLDAEGYFVTGRQFGRAIKQVLVDKREPDWLEPVSATARGSEVRIKFFVPQRPLKINTDLPATQDNGVLIKDDVGTLALSNAHIENGDEYVVTVDRALGANPVVRLAMDYQAPSRNLFAEIGTCNLTDSTATAFRFNGTNRKLPHVCPHAQLPIIPLAS